MDAHIHFGTDGIRGNADEFPFTPEALIALGHAIAQWSIKKYGKPTPRALLGHDTRISCDRIKKNLILGLSPLEIIDGMILPSPAVLQLIQQPIDQSFDFGIVISASHNPYTDNGIKLFDAKTGKLSPEDETMITTLFNLPSKATPHTTTPWPEAHTRYLETLATYFSPRTKPLGKKKIVIDCANGAAAVTAPKAFAHLTQEAIIICEGVAYDGKNINKKCGATYPQFLQTLVKKYQADIGFSFDGDGDRIIAANKYGEIKDGDDLLALLLQHPEFEHEKEIVGTVMTNHGFERYLAIQNRTLIRTKVGDKYVAARMAQDNIILGGETSGHIIMRTYLNSGDGLFVALKVLESITHNNNWEMKTFIKTPQCIINVPIAQKKDLTTQPYTNIIDAYKMKLLDGRIIVRYSGTENLLRVMVEDQTNHSAETIAQQLSEHLQHALAT